MFEPALVGVLWTMRLGPDVRRCFVRTHPTMGVELVIEHNGALLYSHASRHAPELIELARERRKAWEVKGWKEG